MATKFPTLIEWMEQKGFTTLRREYESANQDICSISFDDFCRGYYEDEESEWNYEMIQSTKQFKITYEMDEEGDICLESAKIVLKEIVNNAIAEGMVSDIILVDEMAPDYDCSTLIANDFSFKVINAINRMLKNLN